MAGRRYAVLVASSRFPEEPLLDDLRLPENDVDGLSAILQSEVRGQFTDVILLKNRPSAEILRAINRVLASADRDDLALIYYSGHGKLNRLGQLHLATVDTSLDVLEATSVPVQSIKNFIDVSPSNKVILILDCCYSGAAGATFTRGSTDDQLQQISGGRGTYIMTASTGVQVAVEKEGDQYGVFTKQLIEGLQGDEADANGDGFITVDELYGYIRRKIGEEGAQEPMKWDLNVALDDLVISRSARIPWMERRNQVRERVLDLARQGILPNAVVSKALEVIDLPPDQLTGELQRYDVLLDQLLREEMTVGDFIHQWYIAGDEPPTAVIEDEAEAPAATVEAEESPAEAPPPQPPVKEEATPVSKPPPRQPPPGIPPEIDWQPEPQPSPTQSDAPASRRFSRTRYAAIGVGIIGVIAVIIVVAIMNPWPGVGGTPAEATPKQLGQPLTGHTDGVRSVAFSPNGQTLSSVGGDGAIILWDVASHRQLSQVFTGHTDGVVSESFSRDGQTLASGGYEAIRLWDVAGQKPLGQLPTSEQTKVYSVAFSPDGTTLASADSDGAIILWDVAEQKLLGQLPTSEQTKVYSVAFSPDRKTLASGGEDGAIILWDVAGQRQLGQPLKGGHTDRVFIMAFSPDGKTLASGSWDKTVILWDVAGQKQLGQPFKGYTDVKVSDAIVSVAFSPDGKTLASGSGEGAIILWDVAGQKQLGQPLKGHRTWVDSVAFSPDGKTLASGGGDGAIILWDVGG